MSAKYTPGPWEMVEWHCGDFDIDAGGRGPCSGRIASAHSAPDEDREEESWANGRLLAAAPELLEALKNLIGEIDARSMGRLEGNSSLVRFVDAGRAAIAKAKAKGE